MLLSWLLTLVSYKIPSKLRDKFAIEPGDKVEFFSTYVDGVMYLCMACPHAASPREEAEN